MLPVGLNKTLPSSSLGLAPTSLLLDGREDSPLQGQPWDVLLRRSPHPGSLLLLQILAFTSQSAWQLELRSLVGHGG